MVTGCEKYPVLTFLYTISADYLNSTFGSFVASNWMSVFHLCRRRPRGGAILMLTSVWMTSASWTKHRK